MAANYKLLKGITGKEIIAVVKADAYGHGANAVAKKLEACGCKRFAVAEIDEALRLRAEGIGGEIIVLGFVPLSRAEEVKCANVALTVYDANSAQTAHLAGAPAYIKIDTGMGRLGFSCAEEFLAVSEGINVVGAFTHYAAADGLTEADRAYTARQSDRFSAAVSLLKKEYGDVFAYAANSAAAIAGGGLFDGARIGLALYGINPFGNGHDLGLSPIMAFKSVISSVKTVCSGSSIGYGCTYTTSKKTTVAVVEAGYADGYPRKLSNCGRAMIRGLSAPVIGRVSMDRCVIDVSEIGAKVGEEVLLFGDDPSVSDVARMCGAIPYEILCGVSQRVPRFYIN